MLTVIIAFACALQARSEQVYPEVGKPCPNFLLHNIRYYKKKEAGLEDFKGKWLVLDFWNKQCGACVSSFPKTSKLQNEFKDHVQFMLVGIEDKERQIEPMYRKYREKQNLSMPCAFDSALANRWDIYVAPYLVVIDPKGTVRAITYSVDRQDIQGFLDGKDPKLPKAYRMHEEEIESLAAYDENRLFLVNGNGGDDTSFLFRSVLSPFSEYKQPYSVPEAIDEHIDKGRFQVLGVPLHTLYNYAYFGVAYPNRDSGYKDFPVLEIKDSGFFKYSKKNDLNFFCYSTSVPLYQSSKQRIQEIMRLDLEKYFPYSVSLEERKFPCWRLIATDKARQMLITRGGSESFEFVVYRGEFIAKNWPFSRIVTLLRAYNEMYIVDETGLGRINIDLHLKALLADTEGVRKELKAHGLSLEPGERTMKVLVVKDKLR